MRPPVGFRSRRLLVVVGISLLGASSSFADFFGGNFVPQLSPLIGQIGKNLAYATQLPDPPPGPYKHLSDFCAPNPTPNPNYHGLRLCVLSWRLHYKNPGGAQELIGPAIDLGVALGINLAPSSQPHTVYPPGVEWTWVKPSTSDWADYVLCGATDANKWRVPHEGGDHVQINFTSVKADRWSYLIQGSDSVTPSNYSGPFTSPPHTLDIGEMVYFILIHKDDLPQAQKNWGCAFF